MEVRKELRPFTNELTKKLKEVALQKSEIQEDGACVIYTCVAVDAKVKEKNELHRFFYGFKKELTKEYVERPILDGMPKSWFEKKKKQGEEIERNAIKYTLESEKKKVCEGLCASILLSGIFISGEEEYNLDYEMLDKLAVVDLREEFYFENGHLLPEEKVLQWNKKK